MAAGRDAPLAGRALRVGRDLVLPAAELLVRRTRSGGPGGQNVNKVATRVELEFDVERSSVLSAEDKARIRAKLGGRMSRAGVLRVVAQSERSQARNESEARRRLAGLLERALAVPRPRRPTRPTAASRTQRLEAKRRRSAIKRNRSAGTDD
jgi:ribosome-associated protein